MLPGIDMEVHQDQNHRDYSSVLYLNDNFTGGKTYFPSDNFTCNPKKGKIIFFSSRTYHGVTKVISGERYTLPCWYSKNQNNIYLPQ
jgi:leucine proline-enriched proteoglycan (leprecan)